MKWFCTILFSLTVSFLFSQKIKDIYLFDAIKNNNQKAVEALVMQGANVNARDSNMATPLMWAAYTGNLSIFKYLVRKGADYTKKGIIYLHPSDPIGSILNICAAFNDTLLLKYCLKDLKLSANEPSYSLPGTMASGLMPLHIAALYGRIEATKILLSYNGAINAADPRSGNTPFIYAFLMPQSEYLDFLSTIDSIDMFKRNKEGLQVFHIICSSNDDTALINFFITLGYDINSKSNNGLTPLMIAAFKENRNTMIALLKAGADIELQNDDDETAFDMAMAVGKFRSANLIQRYGEGYRGERIDLLNDSMNYQKFLHTIADSFYTVKRYDSAEKYYLSEKNLSQKLWGENSLKYAISLNDLGLFYLERDSLKTAAITFKDAVRAYENSEGKEQYGYGISLQNQAYAEKLQFAYDSAIIHFKQSNFALEKRMSGVDTNYINGLLYLSEVLTYKENYNEAKNISLKGIKLLEGNNAVKMVKYAYFLNNLGLANVGLGIVDTAEIQLEKANSMCIEFLGDNNLLQATILLNLSLAQSKLQNYSAALENCNKVMTILTAHKLAGSDTYGTCLLKETENFIMNGSADSALLSGEKAVDFFAQRPGSNQMNTIASLINLGTAFKENNNYDAAVSWFNRAMEATKLLSEKRSYFYGRALMNIAEVLRLKGYYDSAVLVNEQAIKMYKETGDNVSTDIAICIHNIANIYTINGDFIKAIQYNKQANDIFEKINNGRSEMHLSGLNSVGQMYVTLGLYEKALDVFRKAFKILESMQLNNKRWEMILSNNLALLYANDGNPELADSVLQKVVALINTRRLLTSEEMIYYGNLGATSMNIGKYDIAYSLFTKTILLLSKSDSKDKSMLGLSYVNLGDLFMRMGKDDSSKIYIEKGMGMMGENLSSKSLSYNEVLLGYSLLCVKMGRYKTAIDTLKKVIKFYRNFLNYTSLFIGSAGLNDYLDRTNKLFGLLFSASLEPGMNGIINDCLNLRLALKGLSLKNRYELNIALNGSLDTLVINTFNNLKAAKNQLNEMYERKESMIIIDSLEKKFTSIEEKLINISPEYQKLVKERNVDWKQIQQNLKPNEAAVEFSDFNYWNMNNNDTTVYIAYLIRASGDPQMIKLCRQDELEKRINENIEKKEFYVKNLYANSLEEQEENIKANSTLYQLVWKPLTSSLNGIEVIYYSATGLLHRINFAAINTIPKKVLGDRYQFHLLGSTRDVINYTSYHIAAKDEKLLLYGGIQYSIDSAAVKVNPNELKNKTTEPAELITRGNDLSELKDLIFSEQEIMEIIKIAKSQQYTYDVFTASDATEESFKYFTSKKESPGVVHISTHGYFISDEQFIKNSKTDKAAPFFISAPNVFFRSGLYFAGSNRIITGKKPLVGVEDGVVTAYDITNANLGNTKLMVLSACESGLGEIRNTEGVFGLQGAVRRSGCKNLIMSLWEIDDAATKDFMDYFYYSLLKEKRTIYESYGYAQSEMKRNHPGDPYRWASFILME